MKGSKLVFLAATVGLSILMRVRRRKNEAPDAPPPQPEDAAPQLEQEVPQVPDNNEMQGPIEVEVRHEAPKTRWPAWCTDRAHTSTYVRTIQFIVTVVALCGSVFNSVVGTPSQPLMAFILGISLLQVGTLEAILQTLTRSKVSGLGRQASIPLPQEPLEPQEEQAEVRGATLVASNEEILATLPYTAADISGLWIKDRQRSDSMGPACDLMRLHGLLRQAIKVLKGVRLQLTPDDFHVTAVSVIPILKVYEKHAVAGFERKFRRRDQRGGGTWSRLEATEEGIVVHARWAAPHSGSARELFRLVSARELHVESHMRVGAEECRYTTIYVKPEL